MQQKWETFSLIFTNKVLLFYCTPSIVLIICLNCTASTQLYWWCASIILHTLDFIDNLHQLYCTRLDILSLRKCLDCTQHTLSEGCWLYTFQNGQNNICNTFVSLILGGGGGRRIRIFCSAWWISEVFSWSVVIQPLKRRVHKDLLPNHQRDSLKPFIWQLFYLSKLKESGNFIEICLHHFIFTYILSVFNSQQA